MEFVAVTYHALLDRCGRGDTVASCGGGCGRYRGSANQRWRRHGRLWRFILAKVVLNAVRVARSELAGRRNGRIL